MYFKHWYVMINNNKISYFIISFFPSCNMSCLNLVTSPPCMVMLSKDNDDSSFDKHCMTHPSQGDDDVNSPSSQVLTIITKVLYCIPSFHAITRWPFVYVNCT